MQSIPRDRAPLPEGDFVELWPVALGRYNGQPAAFLSQKRRMTSPRNPVLPIPVPDTASTLLSSAMQPGLISRVTLLSQSPALANRDGGLYDTLPWAWAAEDGQADRLAAEANLKGDGALAAEARAGVGAGTSAGDGAAEAKREAFQALWSGKGVAAGGEWRSAYDLLAAVATLDGRARVLSLLIEEEDSREGGISLGGAVYMEQQPDKVVIMGEKVPNPFSPSPSGSSSSGGGGRVPGNRKKTSKEVVECYNDEAVGLALALSRPVHVERAIWEGAQLLAGFTMSDGKMRLDVDCSSQVDLPSSSSSSYSPPSPSFKARQSRTPLKAWEVPSARAFEGMDLAARRACLRASGVRPPRRRAGAAAVDDLLLPLMDEAVRREILIQRALKRGDLRTASELSAGKSERQKVAEALRRAVKEGDQAEASNLMQRLDVLNRRRADRTQDEGSYQKDLDADDWYLENRRRSMGP